MEKIQNLDGSEVRNVTDRHAAMLIKAGKAKLFERKGNFEKKEEKVILETKEEKAASKRQTKKK